MTREEMNRELDQRGRAPGRPFRANQLRRTRKDLLDAAARLTRQGRNPSLDEVAAEAMVSLATAYRHFPDVSTVLSKPRSTSTHRRPNRCSAAGFLTTRCRASSGSTGRFTT